MLPSSVLGSESAQHVALLPRNSASHGQAEVFYHLYHASGSGLRSGGDVDRYGRIVTVGCACAHSEGSTAFAAAKFGVIGITKSLALEAIT